MHEPAAGCTEPTFDDGRRSSAGSAGGSQLARQNLTMFLQIAAGADDDTWLCDLRRGDYSGWVSRRIAVRNFLGLRFGYHRPEFPYLPHAGRPAVAA
jgi:hypothetical protein